MRRLAAALLPVAKSLGMSPWVARLQRLAPTRPVLSPREAEVARLVAAGSSNRGIAARLVISDRTAQNHVQHILTKLGFSHSQIAAWVSAKHADEFCGCRFRPVRLGLVAPEPRLGSPLRTPLNLHE